MTGNLLPMTVSRGSGALADTTAVQKIYLHTMIGPSKYYYAVHNDGQSAPIVYMSF